MAEKRQCERCRADIRVKKNGDLYKHPCTGETVVVPAPVTAEFDDPAPIEQPAAGDFADPAQLDDDSELNVSGQPKARYQWRGSQNLGYLVTDPVTRDFRRYKNGNPQGWTRATTFNKAASSTTSLTDWGKRNVVIGASRRPNLLLKAHGMTHEQNRRELDAIVAELEEVAGAKVGSDLGTYLHNFTERMDAGQVSWRDAPEQFRDQLKLYADTLEAKGFEPVPGLIERTTLIQEFGGVVGTLDRVLYHRPSDTYMVGDLKTGKTMDYARSETECQEWIYAHGVNQHGVYDWHTDTWVPVWDAVGVGNHMLPLTWVSETVGLIIHMPVQGDDAGRVILERADLARGRAYAELCHANRSWDRPKRTEWEWTPAASPAVPWDALFSSVKDKYEAGKLWEQARAAGVEPLELQRLVRIAQSKFRVNG